MVLDRRRIAFIVAAFVSLGFVLSVHGFLPGESQTPLTAIFGSGAIKCLHDQGISSLWNWCMSVGLPVGEPRLTGLAQVSAGWLVSYLPGVDAWSAHQITQGLLVAVAFAGSVLLMLRWRIPHWIALLGTVSYLIAANVIVLNGYPYTFVGYLLLPAFVYASLRMVDQLDAGHFLQALVGFAVISLYMVFTDGYVFFSAALVIALLVLGWASRGWSERGAARSVAGCLIAFASLAGAAAVYASWAPGGAYETHVPFEVFGLLGVDVLTLAVPSWLFMFPRALGIAAPQLHTWGISDTLPTNYLGYLTVALVAAYFVVRRRRARMRADRELSLVAIVAIVALILSLGPTLKVGQVAPGLDASLLRLPTAWVYEHVPGFSDMRATNRWLIVTRLCLIVLASAALGELWGRWRQRGSVRLRSVAIVVIAVLAFLETAPNLGREYQLRVESTERIAYLRDGIVAEGSHLIRKGETVLMLPSNNDFLANYLVPMVGARSYNVGGDKNYDLSMSRWPQSVRAARDNYGPASADYLCKALATDVDAIVLPYMSMYYGPLLKDNIHDGDALRKDTAALLAADPRFDAQVGEWMTVLRPADATCAHS